MGRGKKKGGKKSEDQEKELVESVKTLTLSESEPSTSEVKTPAPAPPATKPAEEEEDSGLGLGSSKNKRPKKKKQPVQADQPSPASGEPHVRPPTAAPHPSEALGQPQLAQAPPQQRPQPGPPSQQSQWTQQQAGPPGQGLQQKGPPGQPQYQAVPPVPAQRQGGQGAQGQWQGAPPGQVPQERGPPGQTPWGSGQASQQVGPPPGQAPQQRGPPGQAPRGAGPPSQAPQQGGPPPGQAPKQRGPPGQAPWGAGPPSQAPQQGGPPPGQAPQQRGPPGQAPWGAGPPSQAPQQGGPPPGQAPQQRGPPGQAPWGAGPPSQAPQQRGPPPGQVPQQRIPQGQAPQQKGAPLGQTPRGPIQTTPQRAASGQVQPYSRFTIPNRINGRKVPSRAVKLLTNYLAMKITPKKIYRYDAGFVPDRPKKFIPKVFVAALQKNFPRHVSMAAFDQMKNFYTVEPLPNVSQTERFVDKVEYTDENGRVINYEVSFKATGVIDFTTLIQYMTSGGTSLNPPTEAIQCVDVILRQGTLESYIKAGRQFFRRPDRPILLGDGLEMWTGLFQSAIFTSRPFVNIDVAHKGFPIHQDFIKLLESFRLDPRRSLDTQRGRGLETLTLFLKGLKVVARIGGDSSARPVKREYIVNELAKPASQQMFMMTDAAGKEKQCSVYDYFLMKGCRLQYPNLNCLWVGPRDKSIYYPMEVLEVAYGQVRNRQLNEFQLSTMVREAATPPDERKRKIEEVIRNMNYSRNPYFKKFGLEISDQFTNLNGKVLFAPKMDCGKSGVQMPRKGVWNSDSLLQGMAMTAWGIIAVELDPRSANAEAIVSMFQNQGRQMGMTVAEPIMRQFNVTVRDLENVMRTAVQKRLQMMVVVVSGRVRDVYSHVKKMAERTVGLLTQCIKENTAARRMNPQTVRNILLKVNSKLMGTNHAIDAGSLPECMRKGDIMVVGADVTHPSPDQSNIPSIAAVTASIDKRCFKYNIEFSIQTPKLEMIVEFEDMMFDHLKVYQAEQNSLPNKIYVFRDGVSEGQFAQVMHSELQAVYNAYHRIAGPNRKPEVLFLLVQKRHHTRFFLENGPYNVEPGTCVDDVIVHPRELDFYLVSHQAIKGTARPTRYHAVCNDGGLPHDEVEQLTYYLCHLYSRCTRAVSYPTPTYYAHLACLRARTLTLNERFDNRELERQPRRFHVLSSVKDNSRMFFV